MIFTSTGVALHTTQLTLHRLGKHSGYDFFKKFILSKKSKSAIAASAERLAIYTSLFGVINSAAISYDEFNGTNNDKINEKSLSAVRDLIISTVTITGYLMQKTGSLAIMEGMAWITVMGTRLLAIGLVGGLILWVAWEATFGLGRSLRNYQHRIGELMDKKALWVDGYFEENEDAHPSLANIRKSVVYQKMQDQSSFGVVEWVKYSLGDSKDNIPWGKLNWRAIIPAFELGLEMTDIKRIVDFPYGVSGGSLYPMGGAEKLQLQSWLKYQPENEAHTFYQRVIEQNVQAMNVEAIIRYYQRLLEYEDQDELIANGISYAELARQLREGIFTPNISSSQAVYEQHEYFINPMNRSNSSLEDTVVNIRYLQYDRIKVKKEKNGVIYFENEMLKINDVYFSWNNTVFQQYI